MRGLEQASSLLRLLAAVPALGLAAAAFAGREPRRRAAVALGLAVAATLIMAATFLH